MKPRRASPFLCLLLAAVAAPAAGGPLRTFDGQELGPAALTAAEGIRVFVFVRTDCPISNRFAPEIRRIVDDYAERAVTLTLVYVEPELSRDAWQHHRSEYDYGAGAIWDPQHALVDLAGVRITPEVAVYHEGRLAYRGRVNDRYVDFGKTRAAPTRHDLRVALEELLGGSEVSVPRTEAVGCYIPDLRTDLE